MCVRACESENVFRWCAFFSALICLSLVVIVLAGLLSTCARVCTSSEVPELPSNITQGLCFDPPASPSPQPAPKHIVINVPVVRFQVGNTQMHTSLLSPQRFRFPHSLPHFQRQCAPPAHHLPVSVVWGACNGRGRLGSSPHLLCHQRSQSFTPLAAAPQPKAAAAFLYSTLERERRSHLHFCERLPGIFCSILLGFREVGDEWCMSSQQITRYVLMDSLFFPTHMISSFSCGQAGSLSSFRNCSCR